MLTAWKFQKQFQNGNSDPNVEFPYVNIKNSEDEQYITKSVATFKIKDL